MSKVFLAARFQKRRRRIDRSMIGEPTNFVHTTHVGSGDMGLGMASVGFTLRRRDSRAAVSPLTVHPLLFAGGPRSGPDEI